MICRPAAVIHTVAISMVLLPATTRSAVAVSSPRADKLDHLRNRESVRQHDRLGHAVAVQFESAAAVGPGPWRRWQSRASAESMSAEHARVYPNARSDTAAASKTNARVGLRWASTLGSIRSPSR
jgi:hypothetical protein